MIDEKINAPTTEESSAVQENCSMCGAKNSATLNQPNGGWTDIDCSECGGGIFYLWIRGEKTCTRSLTMIHK
jgi:hypothetical protein